MTAMQFVREAGWRTRPQGALHADLTADGKRIVLVAAGNDWDVQLIATQLEKLTALGQPVTVNGRETEARWIPCTWANFVQLANGFNRLTGISLVIRDGLRDWAAAEYARRIADPPELEKSWPPWLEPRDYQAEAARMIAQAGRFLLLDDMGTGKSCTTILGVEQRYRMGISIFPMVILVPSWEVADAWAREITTWMPAWGEPAMYEGTGRLALLADPRVKVLITTYETARRDASDADAPLPRFAPPCVILDEASLLQNAKTKRAAAAGRITRRALTVIELSGTLITRDVGRAAQPLRILDKDTWASAERYRERFCLARPSEFQAQVTGLNPLTEPEFRFCLLGQMIRRAKADVLKELPPKTYTVLRPEIPPEWRKAYDDMEADMLAALPGNEEELSVFDTLSQLTRLMQLASSAADVRTEIVLDKHTGEPVIDEITGEPKKKQVVTLRPPSWKAGTLMGILAASTEPVAVFTASRQLARITGEHYLKPAGLRYGYVIGQGDGVTRKTRQQAVEDFQAGKLDAIVCTAGAGGLGITLTRAPTAVMLQRPFPLDQAVQPEDRLHRLGQVADKVEIVDVVAKGTADERVRRLLREKAGQWGQFAQDPRIVRELLGGIR